MSSPVERTVRVNGHNCRVLEKGDGPTVGYLAGLIGLPRWTPFLDKLAEDHRVIVPSLPGFPGATGHDDLDHLIDWVAASLDLLEGAGLAGCDLIGASVGGLLAAEIAALSPATIDRLVLIGPLGLYDKSSPVPHLWAKKAGELNAALCNDSAIVDAQLAVPEGIDPLEWRVQAARAASAGARLLWPMCDLGLAKRLHRVRARTLVLWGADDALLPAEVYAPLFAEAIAKPCEFLLIAGAGHQADLDKPVEVAGAINKFFKATDASRSLKLDAVG